MRELRGSALVELLLDARARGAVDLAVGSPTFPRAQPAVFDAAHLAMRAGRNQYENPAGYGPLREAIGRRAGLSAADSVNRITVTAGATEALLVALLAFVEPGCEVIVLEPYYENFLGAIALAGGVPKVVRMHPPQWRWRSDQLRRSFGPRTSAVLVNTPGNPTGRVLTADELTELTDLAGAHRAVVVADEVYAEMVFDGRTHVRPSAAASDHDRVVSIGSVSKSHGLSGWRVGWLEADPRMTKVMRPVHEFVTAGTAAPLQIAVAELLSGPGSLPPVGEFQARRDRMVEALAGIGVRPVVPQGACYVMGQLPRGVSAGAYARRLVADAGVAVAPCAGFLDSPLPGGEWIRLAFNKSDEDLEQAYQRLRRSGNDVLAAMTTEDL